ncbi:TldD/PmbA family protein [Paenibacillus sabinae]|uniref:Zn-dependent protease n=1 Tax=Paenibacillus sabinae T27 TaxID=1268072 RepID=X4ZF22_9BACL|nr:TldD/PmbA family protein [Paenibacillus sabinae]AHV98141.1 Zn-dependent protease [Paenibacillus sabinae T27]
MNIGEFQEALFAKGREAGFAEMEIYYANGRSVSVSVLKGEIDEYKNAQTGGLSFRGLIGGKMGYSSTERLDQESIDYLLEEARSNAEVLENEEPEELFAGSERYHSVNTYSPPLIGTVPDQLIEAALSMERIALDADPRIDMVRRSATSVSESEVLIVNTKGLNCHRQHSSASASIYVLAKESKDAKETVTGGWFDFSLRSFDDIDVEAVALTGVREAVSKLGANTVPSDNYPVILRNDAATSLLSSFASVFSAESVDKGFSRLKGKLGEQVAGGNISIIDDPLMENAPTSKAFDAEGSATARHELVKDGRLLTFLHNRKTARKAGAANTANAAKGGYKGMVEVSHHNLYIAPGTDSLDEIIRGTDRGILIVELQGLHAGTNATSGSFSLAAIGYLIEHGEIVRPVNQITVSGNFFELLNGIETVGDDPRFIGSCTSPTLKVSSLSVSGA